MAARQCHSSYQFERSCSEEILTLTGREGGIGTTYGITSTILCTTLAARRQCWWPAPVSCTSGYESLNRVTG